MKYDWKRVGQHLLCNLVAVVAWVPVYHLLGLSRFKDSRFLLLVLPIIVIQSLLIGWIVGRDEVKASSTEEPEPST